MGFETLRVAVNGVDTAVLVAGDVAADPVVFLHGGGTATGFDALLPLAERRRLVVPVHPGFGGSGGPPCSTVFDLVRHSLDVIDRLGITTFDLIGQSMGGWTAATLASFSTERLDHLVLACPYGRHSVDHPTVDLLALAPEEVPAHLAADLSVFGPPDAPPPTAEFLADRAREAGSFAAIAGPVPYDPSLEPWLHRIDVPTLILWGDADRLIPPGQAAEWAALVPGSEVALVPGAGHLVFDERPAAVATVAAFLDR